MVNNSIKIDELKLIENFDILFNNKIVIYGSGISAQKIYRKLKAMNIPIFCFCNSYENNCGILIDGVEVVSSQKLAQIDNSNNIAIIIATDKAVFIEQIIEVLAGLRLKTGNIFTMLALDISITQNIYDARINENFRSSFLSAYNNIRELQKLELCNFEITTQCQAVTQCIERYMENIEDIILFTAAKVGTITVANSLFRSGVLFTRMHYLNDFYCDIKAYPDYIDYTEKHLYEYHKMLKSRKKVKIITLMRDPIDRSFSELFTLIGAFGFNTVMFPGSSFVDSCTEYVKECIQRQLAWFDNEIKSLFDIDIFTYPFDKEKGFSIIKKDNIEVLVLKLEKLNNLETVIGSFVDAPDIKLNIANEGANKIYKYLYNNIKKVVKIKKELFESVYNENSKVDHFYSDDEKIIFENKWNKH